MFWLCSRLLEAGRVHKSRGLWLVCWALAIAAPCRGQTGAATGVDQCRRNLRVIHDALMECKRVRGAFPARLGDLAPQFLNDPQYLNCPVEEFRKAGDKRREEEAEIGLPDPLSNYDYELGLDLLKPDVWSGPPKTSRDYKLRQRELVGDAVPMVRCRRHPRRLNLSFDRRVYESDLYWEVLVRHLVPHQHLTPEWVFSDRLPLAPRLAPPSAATPARCLDLTPHYNAHPQDDWLSGELGADDSLGSFPAGLHQTGGVTFDARGIVQLDGKCFSIPVFPDGITNVTVRLKPKAIHFLQSVHTPEERGRTVALVVLHFAGGIQRTIPIRYGLEVADWRFEAATGDAEAGLEKAKIGWMGDNAASLRAGKRLRLFHTIIQSPLPESLLESLDYVSALSRSAPFLLAITCE